jgi:hypothetical protein
VTGEKKNIKLDFFLKKYQVWLKNKKVTKDYIFYVERFSDLTH